MTLGRALRAAACDPMPRESTRIESIRHQVERTGPVLAGEGILPVVGLQDQAGVDAFQTAQAQLSRRT